MRWVFHSEVSESRDAYQEPGRSGRDGEPAQATLFYRSEDVGLRRFFAGGGHVGVDEIAQLLDAVRSAPGPVDPADLQDEVELSQTKLTTAISRLEEAGALAVQPAGTVEASPGKLAAAVRAAVEAEEPRRSFDRSRVDMMRGYAEADGCRREFVLTYFGEPFAPPYGNCDNCEAGRGEAAPSTPRSPSARASPTATGARA